MEGDAAQRSVAKAKKATSAMAWMSEMGMWQPDMPNIEGGVRSAWLAEEKSEAHRLTRPWAEKAEDRASPILRGQVLEGSMVSHPPCAVKLYSASMDR